ncbi:predicted membrane protein [Anaerolinea thermolimosa]|uniref:DUF4870 domain-containing protein n=1 Tax=Anaerolinea thermolimosa TaxID=229919 RepID=UPI0007805762|nr:DUF4870 domain-containing protein [Anaerolinea thermolimosa]GAP06072.1 predicted membrane protein [Anaerolinea thermolimosa]
MESPAPQIESTSDDRLWVLLGYIFTPIIPIVVLLLEDKKNRPFIKAHNMQALILGIVEWIINILLSFVVIGCITSVLTLILNIYLGIKANRGEVFEIPVITKFVRQQGW